MTLNQPESYYRQRIASLTEERKLLIRRRNMLAWLRFISVAAAFAAVFIAWPYSAVLAIALLILFTGLFTNFLVRDLANRFAIQNTDRLLFINENEVKVLDHDFLHLPDGHSFSEPAHPYAGDLDIFGRASLYQYINRTTTEQGASELSKLLLNPCDEDEIRLRQQAAIELAGKPVFRQQLHAYGLAEPVTTNTEIKINNWLVEESPFVSQYVWQTARVLLPAISLSLLVLYLINVIPASTFTPCIVLMMVTAYTISRMVNKAHISLSRIAPQLGSLSNSIQLIEETSFESSYLQQVKAHFANKPRRASDEITSLTRILERFDYKLNFIIHIPLNTFLFWDLQQLFSLEKWKKRNKKFVTGWFRGLALMEAASCFGTLSFNHPGWTYPVISKDAGVFDSVELGHPLISPAKRVTNSFTTKGLAQLNMITGSNMAGKSTFLRSAGINMVLALAGAPVCASKLEVSYMKVMSSMRISDNLEESTSTFYAELKKLKEIIDAVNNKERVFLLLDEILRGTNSADRHTGSKALVRQLIHHEATGMLATHDLELSKMAAAFPVSIRNYHFDVQVANEELYFDYKLKEGVCQSMNASLLMKKIGIELDE